MYTVYVVDDDPIVLEEIVNAVPWMDNGYEVIGFNAFPEPAVNEILQLQPDLIFTDLKMVPIDGITLIKRLQDVGFVCEYVMPSVYPSFEESRDFFRLHGFDYLLKPFQQPDVQLVLERLAAKLAQKHPAPQLDNQPIHTTFEKILSYLQENSNKKHSLKSLSNQFGLAPTYICRLFSKNSNTTLTRYITDLRMKVVALRVQEGDQIFKVIAVDCGYQNYYYFSKVLKDYYGQSPSEYIIDKGIQCGGNS